MQWPGWSPMCAAKSLPIPPLMQTRLWRSQSTAPSRQLVAELRDSLTPSAGTVHFTDVESSRLRRDHFFGRHDSRLMGTSVVAPDDNLDHRSNESHHSTECWQVGPVFFGELSGGTNFASSSMADGTTIISKQWRCCRHSAAGGDVVWRRSDDSARHTGCRNLPCLTGTTA